MRNINDVINFIKERFSLQKGDVIYIVSHKKKRTVLTEVLDIVTGGGVDLINSYQESGFRYLVATTEHGKIYQITDDRKVFKVAEIENWSIIKKDNFNVEVIENIKYKKIRKVVIEE